MANTTADKLAKLNATKADLKAALAEKGQTVGDVFSEYPAAVRAISGGGTVALKTGVAMAANQNGIIIPNAKDLTFIAVSISNSDSFSNGIASAIVYMPNGEYQAAVCYKPPLSDDPQCITGEPSGIMIDSDSIFSQRFPFNTALEYTYFAF